MYTIIARWNIRAQCESKAIAALRKLATEVKRTESGTLLYCVHVPDMKEVALPPPSPTEVVFFEGYRNKAAFLAHLKGPVFQEFVTAHKDLFVCVSVSGPDGKAVTGPFMLVETLKRLCGFIRPVTTS